MPIFGASVGGSSNLPIDLIRNMRSQGLDNNQIIQSLQREGYSSSVIFDAMNQADMPSGDPVQKDYTSDQGYSEPQYDSGMQENYGRSQNIQTVQPSFQTDISTEELVEAIIDEKWNDLMRDLNKIVEWKNFANNKLVSMEQKIEDLKREFDKLHSALISKIDDYDKNITNVGAEVRAMEKVFSKVLPVFTENISELSRITRGMKKPSDSKK